MNRDHGRPGSLSRQAPQRRRLRPATGRRRVPLRLLVVVGALVGGLALWVGLRGRSADPAEPAPHTARAAIADALAGVPEDAGIASEAELAEATDGEEGARTLAEVIEAEGPGPIGPGPASYVFGPPDPFNGVAVSIERGETLFQALLRGGVSRMEAGRIVAALRGHVNFSALRPGDRFDGVFWLDEELIEGTFRSGTRARWRLRGEGGSIVAAEDPLVVRRVTEVVRGTVDTSLFQAIQEAGERPQLIMSFVNMFRWDFDFGMQTRRGDRFEMLVEKEFVEDRFYGYGPILAARYQGSQEQLTACWFDEGGSSGLSGYFHADGRSVKRAFLRAPVEFSRISSRFSKSRLHPTLGIRRPHSGVDYAAPTGTPVYSVGDGLVIDAGRMGGAGLAVRVRHNNGWITSYSHLSRILVRKGERVKQGQIVGRVGSTGYSTGPHLDFRIKIGSRFVDPLKVDYPKGDPVPARLLTRFQSSCQDAVAQIEAEVRTAALGGSR
jgi:murein DD-endopeptidase MepM/ murein hydrolase activator NlpD